MRILMPLLDKEVWDITFRSGWLLPAMLEMIATHPWTVNSWANQPRVTVLPKCVLLDKAAGGRAVTSPNALT